MTHPQWTLGFEDEVWWSRLAHPALHAWAEPDRPLRLVAQTVAKDDPDPKALACYGLLLRQPARDEQLWLRFVEGRPVSAVTLPFLEWCCGKLEAHGVRVKTMKTAIVRASRVRIIGPLRLRASGSRLRAHCALLQRKTFRRQSSKSAFR